MATRSHDDYPVFIGVHNRDIERWMAFFAKFGVDATIGERPYASAVDGNIHYVLLPQPGGIDVEWVEGNPVIPLDDAVDQMMENRPAYEPGLEIIADEYDIDLEASNNSAATAD